MQAEIPGASYTSRCQNYGRRTPAIVPDIDVGTPGPRGLQGYGTRPPAAEEEAAGTAVASVSPDHVER